VKPRPDARKSCLHLVAGAGQEALDDCVAHSAARDALLFVDAGVLHLLRHATGFDAGSVAGAVAGAAAVHFLAADLQAQGLLELARRLQVSVVEDPVFCELLVAHDHCLTWT
jgi:sulfur relay protein TusB/DsrH